ncbi:MAG: glycosyltransferase [Candidatus Helarchaeota archaeon]
MKVSGATFCRNIIELDYPIVEAITSILPIVDEFIVNVGDSHDGTLELIKSINSSKIIIIESKWDDSLRKDGLIFSQQAQIAINHCTGDWVFYLNADEVVHEDDLPKIYDYMERYLKNEEVLGFMFRYLHFDGDYWSVNPWRYRKEIRIIRNNGKVRAHGDMTGFMCVDSGLDLKHLKSRWHWAGSRWRWNSARIFHYGWVKPPEILLERNKRLEYYYHDDKYLEEKYKNKTRYDWEYYDILKEFKGSHPKVMENRIKKAKRLKERRNRWLNLRFYLEVFKHGFKG